MDTRLKASLQTVLETWVNEHSSDDIWINGYVPDNFVPSMTNACEVVIDALEDIQKYHERERTSFRI